ncbi:TetR family transcriptional regulator [Streptomyces sp. NPDC059255]|uniref:TetR family transcriptional regulator n=1 Tax=Streptomyces sp. NPDC059255 TaxID=3346793 RepID=UPI0036A1E4EF
MNGGPRTTTRDIARAAVRSELAQVAYGLIRREGFDQVTVSDLAAAAGVSRSTFLRYFGTKEDAVLGAVEAQGGQLADALRARPSGEDDWTALRRSLDVLMESYRRDPAEALATARLIMGTPALCSRQREKQHRWRPLLVRALAERTDPPRPVAVALSVKAGAALECLDIALDHWIASDGHLDLVGLLDEAFAALAPR